MRSRIFAFVAACALSLPAQANAATPKPCNLERLATLPLSFDEGGRPVIQVMIHGREVPMLVDTGGVVTSISAFKATELNLPFKPMGNRYVIRDIDGRPAQHIVSANSFSIGPLAVGKFTFVVMPRMGGTTALLAADIMKHYDVEFDFANSTMNIFRPNRCSGSLAYWAPASATMPFQIDHGGHIIAEAVIDGVRIEVGIDTGSAYTFMDTDHARALFRWRPDQPGLAPLPRDFFGPVVESANRLKRNAPPPTSQPPAQSAQASGQSNRLDGMSRILTYPFKTLSLQGVDVFNPKIVLMPVALGSSDPDIILGMTVLRKLRIYVAYKDEEIYLTPADARLPDPAPAAPAPN